MCFFHFPLILGTDCVFDGTSIYTPIGIAKAQEGHEIKVRAYDLEYAIRINNIVKINVTETLDFSSRERLLQVFNILINESIAQSKDFIQVRRDFYQKKPLELEGLAAEKMRIHPGFLTQVSYKAFGGMNRLVMNVDVSHKIISNDSVLRLLTSIRGNRPWDKKSKTKARKELVKKIVFTSYNTQSYTIENIDFDLSPNHEFKMTNYQTGESNNISYAAYTKKIHNISVSTTDQPLLKTTGRNRQVIHLIPEFCCLTELSKDAKQLLPKTCSVKPHERVPRITKLPAFLNDANEKSSEVLKKFKIKIGTQPIKVNYRVMPKPTLVMPGRGEFTPQKQWGPDLRDLDFNVHNPTQLTIFYTYGRYDEDAAHEISKNIEKEFRKTHSHFKVHRNVFIDVHSTSHLEALRSHNDWKNVKDNNVTIVSIFSDDFKGQNDYKNIKEYCARFGHQHQGVNSRNFSKSRNKAVILGNVARQILNKFGKLCYTVPIDVEAPFLKGRNVLFIGIDVYHSKINYEEAHMIYYQRRSIKSYIGYAVSAKGQYKTFAHCVSRTGGQEVLCSESDGTSVVSMGSDNTDVEGSAPLQRESGSSEEGPVLGNFVKKICNYLKLPKFDLIVVYRDGVADSQIEFVQKEEVQELQTAAPNSKLAFFVVQKEIHSRFFLTHNGEYFNVPGGTIIDQDAVNPQPEEGGSIKNVQPRDFFLVPVDSNLSTCKPVRYVAIHLDDVCTMKDNYSQLQRLTYALCHMYPNWPDSIKVPCVTQMAHKMAYHIGEIKMREPEIHEVLFESIFYL